MHDFIPFFYLFKFEGHTANKNDSISISTTQIKTFNNRKSDETHLTT